jgi:hypothetical protein
VTGAHGTVPKYFQNAEACLMNYRNRIKHFAEEEISAVTGKHMYCNNLSESIQVRVYRDIKLVDPVHWDSLVPDHDLQTTHRFIRTCQESGVENAKYWYLLLYRGSIPVAFAALSLIWVSIDLLSTGMVRKAINWLRPIWPDLLHKPVLFCGLPVSFGNSCLRFRKDIDKTPLLAMIAKEMEKIAISEGVDLLCFKEFQTHELTSMDELLNRGYFKACSLPYCTLDLEWKDFKSYLSQLRAGYRRQVLAGLKKSKTLKLKVQLLDDLSPVLDRVFDLYSSVMDRAENQLERLNRDFFHLLNKYLPSESRVLTVQEGDRILSCAVLLSSAEVVTFLIAGIDYDLNRRTLSYVNLIHEILRFSLNMQAKHLHLGQTSYYIKRRLGARVEPLYIYLRHRNRILNKMLLTASPWLMPETNFQRLRVFRKE